LVDEDLLEAALEGGILFDVLAVLVQGGGADAAELALFVCLVLFGWLRGFGGC
jgi:hypothetical protein